MKKHAQKAFALGASVLILSSMIVTPIKTEVAKADVTDPGFTNICTDDDISNNNNSTANPSTSPSGSGGTWSQKGTPAYNTAEQIFKYWTSKRGFSGASAAGIIGNIAGAEDPSMKLDQKELGGGSGGGLYQFTPYTKYLQNPQSDKSWSVDNQSDVVWNLELKNNAIAAYGLHLNTSQFANLNDPKKAAEAWERGYERPKSIEATLSKRQAAAQEAYILFGGANIQANSALLGAASAANGATNNGGISSPTSGTANSDNPNCSNTNDSTSGATQTDGDIVKIARSFMGWFHYPNPDRHNVQMVTKDGKLNSKDDLKKDGITDCSGLVWIVLKLAGYNVPPAMGWFTGTMAQDAKGTHKWFKQINPQDAKPGDVIIVNEGSGEGGNGHTAIITENWHGYDTKCINEGGDDETVFHNDGVCEDTIQRQFGSMIQNGNVTIAEPIKGNHK